MLNEKIMASMKKAIAARVNIGEKIDNIIGEKLNDLSCEIDEKVDKILAEQVSENVDSFIIENLEDACEAVVDEYDFDWNYSPEDTIKEYINDNFDLERFFETSVEKHLEDMDSDEIEDIISEKVGDIINDNITDFVRAATEELVDDYLG